MSEAAAFSRRDIVAGTVIAIAMAAIATLFSPGLALIVTFLPGVLVAWLVYLRLGFEHRPLPRPETLLPLYGLALAVQFLHFAEEYATGFPRLFGPLYGGQAIDETTFVTFNMASYALFLLAALGVAFKGIRFLLMPVLFFAIYGVLGNAFAHLLWSLASWGYFPGFGTSLVYWLVAVPLLRRLGLSWRESALVIAGFGALLLAMAGFTMNIEVLRAGAAAVTG